MRTHTDTRPARTSASAPVGGPPSPTRIVVRAPARRARRWVGATVVAAAPVVAVGAGVWWFFLRQPVPPRATLDQAVAGVSATGGTSAGSADGTWTVDPTITNAQGTGTYAGFRVDEVLAGVGSSTAVGRTGGVEGTLRVSGTTLEAARITADLTGVTSNDSRRDSAIQRALDTGRFPAATFVLTRPVDVGSVPADGQRITVAATGDLTIHGVTHSVTLDVQAQLQQGVLVVVGSTDVSFADYGVVAPSAPIVASVDDHGTIEFQLYFTKQ